MVEEEQAPPQPDRATWNSSLVMGSSGVHVSHRHRNLLLKNISFFFKIIQWEVKKKKKEKSLPYPAKSFCVLLIFNSLRKYCFMKQKTQSML